MKKLTVERILTILVIALMVLSITIPMSLAAGETKDYLDPTSVTAQTTSAAGSAQTFLWSVLGIVQVVAVSAAVIMLIILGVKYVSAAPAEKADIKQSAMIYVVGAILMFGATGIIQIIKGFAGSAISANPKP